MNHTPTAKDLAKLVNRAEAGDGAAACLLGDYFREGEQTDPDWKTVFRWYHLGATLGDAESQNNLGTMYQNGLGCESDSTLAAHWYQQSAKQGNAVGQYNLGKRYMNGDGVDLDLEQAASWFAAAGEQGYVDAICDLGTMNRFGHGMPRNLVAAADFHILAAKEGDGVAIGNLSEYLEELQEIALAGSGKAAMQLCEIHNLGLGVEKNMPLTWTWIRWAKDLCQPCDMADDASEIEAAYDFYLINLDPDDRKERDQVVNALRKLRGEQE
jgi:TPR repeat protein